MIDNQFTEDIRAWLDLSEEERDLIVGAGMLLKLNRNAWMHQRIIKKGDMALLEYQLKKHFNIRLQGLTIDALARMDEEVVKEVAETLNTDAPAPYEAPEDDVAVLHVDNDTPQATRRGRREDHDSLPADVQALYDRGGELFYRMKQTHATLGTMLDAAPCDRYEYCKLLKDLHDEYRLNWERYDNFGKVVEGQLTEEQTKVVNAARKYISSNKKKLSEATGDTRTELLLKMQERVGTLLSLRQEFSSETVTELTALGLVFDENEVE